MSEILKKSVFLAAVLGLLLFTGTDIYSAHAEEKTMCGAYGHDEEDFGHPEKSWLEVRGRGIVTLEFDGRTPMYSDGLDYCCFGEYSNSRKTLRVLTGCDEQ